MVVKKKPDKPVWKKNRPKGLKKTTLTPEQKEKAKARAAKAGRPYPNLIDNMAVARQAKKTKPVTRKKPSPLP